MSIHLRRVLKNLLVTVLCALTLTVGHAQAPGVQTPDLYTQAQRWLDEALAVQGTRLPLRMEVAVGQLDPRLKLAPCQRTQPYLPAGTRLWGKTRLGVRCLEGASRWNVFLPVTIKAFGPAWVIKGQVSPGAPLVAADAMEVEVDWAESSSPIVANPSDWVGKTPTRLLSTGQALRQDMVRASQVFQAGAQVRVLASGVGFQIAGRAQAISAGVVGQSARVRMDNGQILHGVVADDRTVRVVL